MSSFLLNVGATVQCFHAASASAQTSNTRVSVDGKMAVTAEDMWTVSGCPFTIPPSKPQPCVTIRWAPAKRVLINGKPAVVQATGSGQGICQTAEQIPQGLP